MHMKTYTVQAGIAPGYGKSYRCSVCRITVLSQKRRPATGGCILNPDEWMPTRRVTGASVQTSPLLNGVCHRSMTISLGPLYDPSMTISKPFLLLLAAGP